MWPADPNSCRFDVPIRMDYTPELWARSDPSPFSGFSHYTLSQHREKEPRHTQPLLTWVSNMPAAKSVNWAEMGEGWLCITAKASRKFQNLFFYKLFRRCFITNPSFVTGSKKDIQKTQKKNNIPGSSVEFTVLDQTRFFLSTGEIQSLTTRVNLLQEHSLTQPFCVMEFYN